MSELKCSHCSVTVADLLKHHMQHAHPEVPPTSFSVPVKAEHPSMFRFTDETHHVHRTCLILGISERTQRNQPDFSQIADSSNSQSQGFHEPGPEPSSPPTPPADLSISTEGGAMPNGGVGSQNTHPSTQETYASSLPGEISDDDGIPDALFLQALKDAEDELVCGMGHAGNRKVTE